MLGKNFVKTSGYKLKDILGAITEMECKDLFALPPLKSVVYHYDFSLEQRNAILKHLENQVQRV
jgi:hypothetical protein